MVNSRIPGPEDTTHGRLAVPARTPGPLGFNDAADPNVTTRLGDTPGPLGMNDYADPTLPRYGAPGAPSAARLADGTPVAVGSDVKAVVSSCPPALAKRSDGGAIDVDWKFISDREGGALLAGYVPNAAGSKSGVTIATGVDLGQRSAADIDKLDITATLKAKLKPYCGKTSKEAEALLKKTPLSTTADEAASLDRAIKQPLLDTLVAAYDAAVDRVNTADQCKRVHFSQLPQGVQTALASINFQYGSLATPTPNFWQQVTEQRWADASKNLANFGDAYPTRRKLEAGLIDAAITAAGAAK